MNAPELKPYLATLARPCLPALALARAHTHTQVHTLCPHTYTHTTTLRPSMVSPFGLLHEGTDSMNMSARLPRSLDIHLCVSV
jgi:hypothetical protein